MAEAAAAEIEANPLLARATGYYHDIGKIRKPQYFIENQRSGKNKPRACRACFSRPYWFSMKYCGFLSLPMSWYRAGHLGQKRVGPDGAGPPPRPCWPYYYGVVVGARGFHR